MARAVEVAVEAEAEEEKQEKKGKKGKKKKDKKAKKDKKPRKSIFGGSRKKQADKGGAVLV